VSLHGHHQWQFAIILRFPHVEAVHAWYNDPEVPLSMQSNDV
jgi:uncharacterized protein (DUF1330 family)